MSTFHVVYPRGDKTKLAVAEISDGCDYEINDYSVASRRDFTDEDEAYTYGKELAKKNNLVFEGDRDNDYLD